MKIKIVLSALLLMVAMNSKAQTNGPIATISSVSICADATTVDIPITVNNFNNVGQLSLTFGFNSSQLSNPIIVSRNTAFDVVNHVWEPFVFTTDANLLNAGVFKVSGRGNLASDGINLGSGAVVFTLRFTVGSIASTAAVSFVENFQGTACEFTGVAANYPVFNDVPTATYYINGVVTKNPLPTIAATATANVCYNSSSQTTSFAYSATTNSPTSYSIDWVSGITDQTSTAFSFVSGGGVLTGINISAGVVAGNYSGVMTITNNNGCSSTQNVSIAINALPIADAITGTSLVGIGDTTTLHANASGVAVLSYVWYSSNNPVASVTNTGFVTANAVGTSQIYYTVTDGSSAHCSASSANFTFNVGGSISGYVTYDNPYATALNNVTVSLKNNLGVTVATSLTGPNYDSGLNEPGYYKFTNVTGGAYTLSATSNSAFGGNNATDALIVQRRAIGSYTLSPLRNLAADVNISSTITALDALYIKLRTVGTITSYPGGNWKFETPALTLTGNMTVSSLKGLCMGDVNGSFVPTGSKASAVFLSTITDSILEIEKGTSFNYDVKSEAITCMGAMTLDLVYNNALFEVEKLSTSFENLKYEINNGKIIAAWSDCVGKPVEDNQTLVSLQVKAKESIPYETKVLSVLGTTEFADVGANILKNVRLKLASVVSANAKGFNVIAFPNPFSSTCNIYYTIPENSSVKITLNNMLGQTIATVLNDIKAAGSYSVGINATDFSLNNGIFFYTIEVKGASASYFKTNKLIFGK